MKANKLMYSIALSLFLIASFFSTASIAAHPQPLPEDKAFALSFIKNSDQQLVAQFKIAPGYYLYRERVHINIAQQDKATLVQYPAGETKKDVRHNIQVYTGNLMIPIQLPSNLNNLALSVDYQGCSDHGFCYPPTRKEFTLNFASMSVQQNDTANSSGSIQSLLTDQNQVRDLFAAHHFGWMLLIFAGIGLLLALTPCVLPMVPILTSIIVGHHVPLNTRKAFFLSLTYVLGSALTYAVAGIVAASMGSSLQAYLQQPWIIASTAGLFVLLAFSLFGFYDLQMPSRWHNRIAVISRKQRGGTFMGAFILGAISSLIVSPCVTAPLVGVLMYIGESGDKVLGASALFAMGMGMGIPLLLIGASAGKWLPRRGPWMEVVKKIFGLLMLFMAIWLLTRISSATIFISILGLLLFTAALFISMYLPKLLGREKLHRSVGYVMGVTGLIFMIGGVSMPNLIPHGSHFSQPKVATGSFVIIHNVTELNNQLAQAKSEHKPVMLDFYADWCESCVLMDKQVFSVPEVKHALHNYMLLRADLSANSPADNEVLKRYNIIAPPTVLFFGADGAERPTHRIVGEVDKHEFLMRANTFYASTCTKKLNC